MQSSCQGVRVQPLKHEMVTGKQSCKLFSSAGLHSQKSVELRWSLCRGPALSASRRGAALCRAPAVSDRLCVGARRSRCRAPALSLSRLALSVSGPAAACVGPALSVWGPALSASGPNALCRGVLRRSLCRGAALSMSGPGNLCRGLCQGPAVLSQCSLCRALTLSLSGSGRVSCRGPVLLVSGPGALCRAPGACRCPALCRPALCRALALSMSGPALPMLSVSGRALSGRVCVGARRSPGALSVAAGTLCVGTCRSVSGGVLRKPRAPIRMPPILSCSARPIHSCSPPYPVARSSIHDWGED